MLADNDVTVVEKTEDIKIYEEMELPEERKDSEDFFTKMKKALSPRSILGFIISGLWKPVLAFILLFTLFLGAVYAGGYFRLFNTRDALNFEWLVADLRQKDNNALKTALPVIEWTSTTMAAAGDLMQSQIDIQAEAKKKQEEEAAALAQKEEETAKNEQAASSQEDNKGSQQKRPSQQEQEKARKQQEAELKKLSEERQKELTKRANQLANYYSTMAPKDAVNILKNLDNEEIVLILERMENDAASQILANFEPDRASAISRDILALRSNRNTILPEGQEQNIL